MFDIFVKKQIYLILFFLIMISLYTSSNKNKTAKKQYNYFNHFTIKSYYLYIRIYLYICKNK